MAGDSLEHQGHEDSLLEKLAAYQGWKEVEPLLVLSEKSPEELKCAFVEARESFRWGLLVATVEMCRVILQNVIGWVV
jgi:hypothetical protein